MFAFFLTAPMLQGLGPIPRPTGDSETLGNGGGGAGCVRLGIRDDASGGCGSLHCTSGMPHDPNVQGNGALFPGGNLARYRWGQATVDDEIMRCIESVPRSQSADPTINTSLCNNATQSPLTADVGYQIVKVDSSCTIVQVCAEHFATITMPGPSFAQGFHWDQDDWNCVSNQIGRAHV